MKHIWWFVKGLSELVVLLIISPVVFVVAIYHIGKGDYAEWAGEAEK